MSFQPYDKASFLASKFNDSLVWTKDNPYPIHIANLHASKSHLPQFIQGNIYVRGAWQPSKINGAKIKGIQFSNTCINGYAYISDTMCWVYTAPIRQYKKGLTDHRISLINIFTGEVYKSTYDFGYVVEQALASYKVTNWTRLAKDIITLRNGATTRIWHEWKEVGCVVNGSLNFYTKDKCLHEKIKSYSFD